MFAMTFPAFIDTSRFAVKSSHNETALWIVSGLALAFNLGVAIYHLCRIVKYKRNPLTHDIYTDLAAYKSVALNK